MKDKRWWEIPLFVTSIAVAVMLGAILLMIFLAVLKALLGMML